MVLALTASPAVAAAGAGGASRYQPAAKSTFRQESSLPLLLQEEFSTKFVLRPKWILPTGDGSGFIGRAPNGRGLAIHWSSWTHKRARGAGTVWIEDSKLTTHPYPGTVVAGRVVSGRFTRLTAYYTKGGETKTWRLVLHRQGSFFVWN